jgi:hypothetical protein
VEVFDNASTRANETIWKQKLREKPPPHAGNETLVVQEASLTDISYSEADSN